MSVGRCRWFCLSGLQFRPAKIVLNCPQLIQNLQTLLKIYRGSYSPQVLSTPFRFHSVALSRISDFLCANGLCSCHLPPASRRVCKRCGMDSRLLPIQPLCWLAPQRWSHGVWADFQRNRGSCLRTDIATQATAANPKSLGCPSLVLHLCTVPPLVAFFI